MVYLTKYDLKRLSVLCDARCEEANNVINSEDSAYLEKAMANLDREYFAKLSAKLKGIADSNAKRIQITFGGLT